MAQDVTTQYQEWSHFQVLVDFKKGYRFHQDIQDLVYISPFRQHMFQSRTLLLKSISKGFTVGAGILYLNQALPQNPNSEIVGYAHELRPIIQVSHRWKASEKWSLSQRLWTEFRFFEGIDDDYHYSTVRFRYRLMVELPLTEWAKLNIYDELHLNGFREAENVTPRFDQNRIGFDLWYTKSDVHRFAIGYLNWYQERSIPNSYFNRHIIKLTYQIKLGSSSR